MFKEGDKIVYPNHGAGTIVGIETKEILGEEKKYYIMELPIGDMKVMIPTEKVEEIGIRDVIDADEADDVFHLLKGEKSKMSQNWNRRFRANMEKLKTGDIFEVGEVVRNLTIRDQEKGLSTGEKKMLSNARQILISELVLAKDKDKEDIEKMLEESFAEEPSDEEVENEEIENEEDNQSKENKENEDNEDEEENKENEDNKEENSTEKQQNNDQ